MFLKNLLNNKQKLICFFFLLIIINTAFTQTAIPTFNSIGLYWAPAGGSEDNQCQVQYRIAGEQNWQEALPLWFDARDNEYRGSIVNLASGTSYEIKLTLQNSGLSKILTVQTWNEEFPIGKTVYLPETSSQTLVIDESGSPQGYILYTPEPGKTATIDVGESMKAAVNITGNAAYIILKQIIIKGGKDYGIQFTGAAHDIVIEKCDISGWGSNLNRVHGGIHAANGTNVERIIIQRNKIHHPRTGSNSWDDGHPQGPQAIAFFNSLGNHVIRYNEIYSDFNHYFNDGIGAGSNDSNEGFPGRDSDIYGNYIANVWDDGIEAEGGGKNVRIWGNFIENTFTKIAIAPVSQGPTYIWRNIAGSSRRSEKNNDPDSYGRGPFLKTGGDEQAYNKGRVYIFHNTVLQPSPPQGSSYPLGSAGGIISSGGKTYEHIARNNIFTNYKGGTVFKDNTNSCTNSLDYDMYNGNFKNNCSSSPHEANGIRISGNEWWKYLDENNGKGEFALKLNSPGIDAGVRIPNFNDFFTGNSPDIGAFERGDKPMEFGVNAYLNGDGGNNSFLPKIPNKIYIQK